MQLVAKKRTENQFSKIYVYTSFLHLVYAIVYTVSMTVYKIPF